MKQAKLLRIIIAMLAIVFLLVIVLYGCQPQVSGDIEVKVVVTQDFGAGLMLDESVAVHDGANALDALQKVATVETKYGGGFIEAINGVRSRYSQNKVKKDWFFYINGMSTNVGGLDYKLCDGDVEHWDFHDWGFRSFIPAIIGDFPQPFLGGYRGKTSPTIIVYDEGFRDASQDIVSKLEKLGVEDVRAQSAIELRSQDKNRSNLILVGTADCDLVLELNDNYDRLGFYARFEDNGVGVLDFQNNKTQYTNCGLIQATQNPWNPNGIGVCENVVWVVLGTDKTMVKNAVAILSKRCDEFRYACAVVIVDEEVIRVPR